MKAEKVKITTTEDESFWLCVGEQMEAYDDEEEDYTKTVIIKSIEVLEE